MVGSYSLTIVTVHASVKYVNLRVLLKTLGIYIQSGTN